MKIKFKLITIMIMFLVITACGSKELLKGQNLTNKNNCLNETKEVYKNYIAKHSNAIVAEASCVVRDSNYEILFKLNNGDIVPPQDGDYDEYEEGSYSKNSVDETNKGSYQIAEINYEELLKQAEQKRLEDGKMKTFIFKIDDFK